MPVAVVEVHEVSLPVSVLAASGHSTLIFLREALPCPTLPSVLGFNGADMPLGPELDPKHIQGQ